MQKKGCVIHVLNSYKSIDKQDFVQPNFGTFNGINEKYFILYIIMIMYYLCSHVVIRTFNKLLLNFNQNCA